VTAWFSQGVRVVDYNDARTPRELGWYIPTGADTLAVKPHRGFLFASDRRRGLDILRYTAPGWPGSTGQAAAEPAARTTRPPARRTGRARVRVSVRIPALKERRSTAIVSVRRPGGELVQRLRFRVAQGRRAVLDFSAAGLSGRYHYDVRLAGRRGVLRRGTFRVRPGGAVGLRRGVTLVCHPLERG
jgi:hypothetical protein